MCNLYSATMSKDAMRKMFGIQSEFDKLGNAEPRPAIWPKYEAPVVSLTQDGNRQLSMMSWGFLTPKVSKKTGKPIQPDVWNNARDDKVANSGLWKESFLHRRCLIPGSSFREAQGRSPATDYWFAIKGDEDRPPFAFAGLWRATQPGIEGDKSDLVTHTMITTTANEIVKPVHPKRMPVILDPEDYNQWLTGSPDEAAELLKPYPSENMRIVMSGVGIHRDIGSEAEAS